MADISEKAKAVLNDPRLIAKRDEWVARLQNLFDGGRRATLMAVNGYYAQIKNADMKKDPEAWVVEGLENLAENAEKLDNDITFTPLCIEAGYSGVHFGDSLFGAEVFWNEDSKQWFAKHIVREPGTLETPDIDKAEAWIVLKRVALEFVRQGAALPFFGLPTIASALNVGINLFGEELLTALVLEPEKAAHDLKVINDLLIYLHQWYRRTIPARQLQPVISGHRTQPPHFGQICGCSTQLLSAEMYETIVAPLDEALLAVYPSGGMMHLCGAHTHLIPAFRSMPHLRAIQVNDKAAWNLQEYFTELRDDQIIYLNQCPGMPLEKALRITGGRRLVLPEALNEPIKI
jgi:hypothetical protein